MSVVNPTLVNNEVARAYGLLGGGKPADAENAVRALIQTEPEAAIAYVLLGHLLRLRGELAQAASALETARRLDASIAQGHAELGLVYAEAGHAARARPLIAQALELAPRDANMHWIAGQAAALDGKASIAEQAFAQAERLMPGIGAHRYSLGIAALRVDRYVAARIHLSAASRRDPKSAAAWANLGATLAALGNLEDAIQAMTRARALRPADAQLASLLARVAVQAPTVSPEAKVTACRDAAALDPTNDDVAMLLVSALAQAYRYAEAKDVARAVVERDPRHLLAHWLSFQLPSRVAFDTEEERDAYPAQWRDGMATFMTRANERGAAAAWAEAVLDSVSNYYLTYRPEPLVDEHRANARATRLLVEALGLAAHERAVAPVTRTRRRVGIVSPHLHAHSVSKVFLPMVAALPRDAFEIVAFYPSSRPDAVTAQWRERADVFVDGDLPLAEWAARIAASDLDVLVYLDIGMHPIMNALTALRLAPVQAAAWGHPVTSGSTAIDYFLSADAMEPSDADTHYVERLVRLPRLGTTFAAPQVAVSPFRDRETIELACVQNAAKLAPRYDALWARILAQCPNTRLSVYCGLPAFVADGLRERLTRALAAAGVDPQRLTVHPLLAPDAFDAALGDVDVLLDSMDFSGGITGFECLARELPIVTLPGPCMRGRQTAAMLRQAGADDLVARDEDDYVAIAVRLCNDAQARRAAVERIAGGKAALFDDAGVAEAFARFLEQAQPPA